jgi:hypothetical protein
LEIELENIHSNVEINFLYYLKIIPIIKKNFTDMIEIKSCGFFFTKRIFALFESDVRISLVNAGLGRSTKSRSLR